MIRHSLSVLILAVGAFAGTAAHAACSYPKAPTGLPDGNTATTEQMIAGQAAVKQYMADMDVYLKCLDDEAPAAPAADAPLSDDQKKEQAKLEAIRAQKHNAAVTEMEQVADQFNAQIRAFRAKNPKK